MYDVRPADRPNRDFPQPIADQIWRSKYRYVAGGAVVDADLLETQRRVAVALAEAEKPPLRDIVADRFLSAMDSFKVIPAGRILAGAGTARNVTLSNTFVMRTIPDSVEGIMDTLKEAAVTMQMGGGIGFDFSTIRPKGTVVVGLDCPAAGPLAAMDIFDSTCKMLVTGMGRGAMMATMRCDHPDIDDFVSAKSDRTRLRNFNLSVLVSDAFMKQVASRGSWDLVWDGRVVRRVNAADLWDRIMRQTYGTAEPGVLFIDRINDRNPLRYLETIRATNSCAEQPLPPYGTCPLASLNLAALVSAPFTSDAKLEISTLRELTGVAVRMLDNALDVSRFPLPQQRKQAQEQRRIGVGVTGVADAIAMLGVRYGSPKAVFLLSSWMQAIQNAAYSASAFLAHEKGAFPLFNAAAHLTLPAFQALDAQTRAAVARFGLRNGALTSIAPTGTISMLAGNVSSGIEPIFSTEFSRRITRPDGTTAIERVIDYAALEFERLFGKGTPLPESFVTAADLAPEDHVAMQAAAQPWVDSGISKTVNCPEDISFEAFKDVYISAFQAGCKGCTTYRPNDITGSILSA